MDSGTIAALIITGIVVMVVVALIAQSAENARQERRRRILVLMDHARQLWSALQGIPPTYLLPEQRQFLIRELSSCYRQVLAVDSRHAQAKSQLNSLEALNGQAHERQIDDLKPAFNDAVAGQHIRNEFKQLVNQVVRLHSEGLVDKATAQRQIHLGKAVFSLVSVDLALLTARSLEQNSKAKAALAHFTTCLKQLKKLDPHLGLSNRVNYVNNRVNALQAEVAQQQSRPAAAAQTEPAQQTQDEWQKFVDSDQQSWKIKQDYE